MEKGLTLEVRQDFGIRYVLGQQEKCDILLDFGTLFHRCTQMMVWFDNGQVSTEQKLEYWSNLYNIFESMHELIVIMLKAGITENEILEQLRIPF
jgi:glutathionylspermidine synthase